MSAVSVSIRQTHFKIHLYMAICYAETERCKEIRTGCIRNGVSNFIVVMLYVKANLLQ
jgi:hypothetical protein